MVVVVVYIDTICKPPRPSNRSNINNTPLDIIPHHIPHRPPGDHRRSRQIQRHHSIPRFPLHVAHGIKPIHHPGIINHIVDFPKHLKCRVEHLVDLRIIRHVALEHERALGIRRGNIPLEFGPALLIDVAHHDIGAGGKEGWGDRLT